MYFQGPEKGCIGNEWVNMEHTGGLSNYNDSVTYSRLRILNISKRRFRLKQVLETYFENRIREIRERFHYRLRKQVLSVQAWRITKLIFVPMILGLLWIYMEFIYSFRLAKNLQHRWVYLNQIQLTELVRRFWVVYFAFIIFFTLTR